VEDLKLSGIFLFKGSLTWHFRLQVFYELVSHRPPSIPLGLFQFYENLWDICNFVFIAGINGTGDKLFTGVNGAGDKLSPVSLI
jgi:hypothetical protein